MAVVFLFLNLRRFLWHLRQRVVSTEEADHVASRHCQSSPEAKWADESISRV